MAELSAQKGLPSHQSNMRDEGTINRPFRFLNLPPELRNEIYVYLFVRSNPIERFDDWSIKAPRELYRIPRRKVPDCRVYKCEHRDEHHRLCNGMLRTCKQISKEALYILYSKNKFCFRLEPEPRYFDFFTVGETNLRNIRHLSFTVDPYQYHASQLKYHMSSLGHRLRGQWQFFRPPVETTPHWKALLKGLATLQFVVVESQIEMQASAVPAFESQLEGVMSSMGENVDDKTDVMIDDNYSVHLYQAVDRWFKKGFRMVRIVEG
ncbi:hypothetical protein F4805DRAFT_393450 [Annulohypoxylon moriforme]|nr:hypothetical protein F4805DRAFT_393450 [Annulohypoxylon moriforme]